MRFFLDTADIGEVREGLTLGLVEGVTTCASLIAGTGRRPTDVVDDICGLVRGPVSVDVVATDAETIMSQARDLARIGDNVVVKIPLIPEGIRAVRRCRKEGIRTNMTLCFSPIQALLAAKSGASYLSPFVGRRDHVGHGGMGLVTQTLEILGNYGYDAEVVVASVRGPRQVLEAARAGAHIATLPLALLTRLAKHPLSDAGLEQSLADWERVPS